MENKEDKPWTPDIQEILDNLDHIASGLDKSTLKGKDPAGDNLRRFKEGILAAIERWNN